MALSQSMNRANEIDITGEISAVFMSSQSTQRDKLVRHIMWPGFRIHPNIQREYAPSDPCHVRILGD
uniref:Uncharacterized protein n=1 Tax=Psilocybe cubensis TaxID=181762 RepID=A0A8H8CDV0_PSICU